MDDQQIEGLPEGATLRPVQSQPAADSSQVEGLPEGATLRPVTTPASKIITPKAPVAPHVTAPAVSAVKKTVPDPQQDAVENFFDKDVKRAVPGTPNIGKAIYETGKGLYQGAVGNEETPDIAGKTSTASPVAEHVGFTPGNVGYNVGKMGRGIYEFGKEAVKDVLGNEPIAIPDKNDKSSFDDPKAHTLVAKYVTAPSMAERQTSQDEMQKYFETKGPEAAGHAISAFLHGTLGEYVPAIGPLAMSLEAQAQKGDIGGALAQIASLYAFEKGTGALKEGIKDRVNAKVADLTKTPEVKQAEANVETLGKEREAAQVKLDAAKAKHQQYTASHAQGIGSPEKVVNEVNKAQKEYDEAEAHHELAKEDLASKQKTIPQRVGGAAGRAVGKVMPTPAPAPEVPTEAVEAKPAVPAPAPPVLGKLGSRPTVSPAYATTTVPPEPTPAPRPSYGRIALAGDQGTMGTPKLLTEGTPEGPQIPKGGLPKITLPEEKPVVASKPATDEAALRALSAKKGEVVETPEKKVGRLLQEALKPAEKAPEYKGEEHREKPRPATMSPTEIEEAMKNRKPVHTPFDVTEGAMETIKRDQAMPKHPAEEAAEREKPALPKEEPTQYAAKNEEVIPAGTEGREPVKSAAEYTPAVEQKVNELSDTNLRQLAKAHGLNPDEYDLNARDERRHRVERDQLAKDITEQMGEDEKINLGRAAASAEKEGTFEGADVSAKGRAARAEKMFPRLRGPVDENGNPKISGGAPDTVGTKEAADRDNEHFANAKKELGPNASISEVAKHAQKLKDTADIRDAANAFNKSEGRPKLDNNKVKVDPRQKELSDAYESSKHEPNNSEVKKSYDALKKDIDKQYALAEKQGYKFDVQDKDPYEGEGFGNEHPAYSAMRKDAVTNKHISAWKGGEPPADHPLSEVDPKTGLTYNEKFRVIHDLFGHVVPDNDFTGKGEENAWNAHRQMFSKEALPALATETRGQTAYAEKHGKFLDQRATILPKEFQVTAEEHATNTLDHIKSGKDFAILTAENPNNERATSEENEKRNRELVADLRKKGYDPIPVEGNTKDVEGQKEHSYFVPDITPKEAAELGRKHGQAAVLTTEGLHDLKEDIVNPSDNKNVLTGEEARKQPYYSKVGDTDFSVPIDFERVAEPGKAPLPTVSGGSGKELPTGDALIKKYGESSGDPKDLTFILKDGRGVKNTGSIHDEMLGGKATDAKPPRERFIAEGNIRVRPHQGTAGREVAFSIPEQGISEAQLKYIQKMSPQLKSGAVMIEVGKPGGNYKAIPYGEATPEAIGKIVREIASVNNEKGSPIDENGNPTVSGGSPAAGAGTDKTKALPKIAEEHLTEEERAGVTKTDAGRKKFVDNLKKLPSVQEFIDIAKAGEGGRKWYQRSAAAFDALTEEAPKYFKEGDRQKFTDFLAALSPQQSVKMNLGEALNTWTKYVDEGRPTGKELEKLLKDELTLSEAKIPNATKALAGEPLWPDLSKNVNFKVPSFAKNLNGYLNHVTNDGWQALFGGLNAKAISKANSYHPLAVVTRAAADALGWSPAEAQAAIWAFTKTFTEKGETLPEDVRRRSEDFADILALDPEIRQQLKQLGVNHEQLDAKLRAIGRKPAITSGASPTTENSVRKLATRIEKARGAGTIPPPKSGNLNFNDEDEAVGFNPKDFTDEESGLGKLGEKKNKSPYGKISR